jgi:hypothetical protein
VVVAFVGFNSMLLALAGLEAPATLRDVPAVQVQHDRLATSPLAWSSIAQATGLYRPKVQTPLRRYPATGSVVVVPEEAAELAVSSLVTGYRKLEALARTYGFEIVLVDTPSFFDLSPSEQDLHPPVTDVDVLSSAAIADVATAKRRALAVQLDVPYLMVADAIAGERCFLDVVHTVGRCSPSLAAAITPTVLGLLQDAR